MKNMNPLIFLILLTAYSNQVGQTDDTPNVTANGDHVHKCGIAVSRDLEDVGFKIGCRVNIKDIYVTDYRMDLSSYCNGLYVINDRMHWRKRNQADIFSFNNNRAIRFGRQSGTIQKLWCK
jgi:3D (Asp-Asp-Asp) domain-containing protein